MADLTESEYTSYRGSKENPNYSDEHSKHLDSGEAFNITGVPDSLDWRDYGTVFFFIHSLLSLFGAYSGVKLKGCMEMTNLNKISGMAADLSRMYNAHFPTGPDVSPFHVFSFVNIKKLPPSQAFFSRFCEK